MVYRQISPDMKQHALVMLQEGWEFEEIAAVLGVSDRSIEQWADNYEHKGQVDPPSLN